MSEKEKLNLIFSTIIALNGMLAEHHFVTYKYEEEDEKHCIIHNFTDELYSDDEFATSIGNILFFFLNEKGFYDWEFHSL